MPTTTTPDTDTKSTGRFDAQKAKAHDAAARAREGAHDASVRAKQAIESNPLGLIAGGLAVGLVAGALVPRSAREREVLNTLGARLAEGALAAAAAAKASGKEQISSALLSRESARESVTKVVESAVAAAKDAGAKAA